MIANVIQTIGSDTGIALTLVISLVGSAVGCTAWIGSRLSKIDKRFGEVNSQLGQVNGRLDSIEQRERDNYTMIQAENHALRFALLNPDIGVPEPRDPTKIINVPVAKHDKPS